MAGVWLVMVPFLVPPLSWISPVRERAWKVPVSPKEVPAVGGDRPKDCRLGMGSSEHVGGVLPFLVLPTLRSRR